MEKFESVLFKGFQFLARIIGNLSKQNAEFAMSVVFILIIQLLDVQVEPEYNKEKVY